MEPLPATFYGDVDQKNPVIATFENEIKQLLGFMRKMQKGSSRESYQQDYRRGSSTLFNIWVKYKPRLPASYYQEKLLKVGDSLVQMKEYRLALFQCYERYLEQFCSADIDDITDVIQFKSTFFPNGVDDKMADLTFHALQGRCICIYQLVKTGSGSRPNEESVRKCLKILSFLQLIMQVVLPQEHLCWLIYNGTLHIYTICRHLLVLGHSSKVLEFLLWASVCLESSVPLLSLAYLPWRTTLYTAVCQCYFDSQAGVHGEVFARRALSKINELSRLQNMSDTSDSEEAKKAFREATLKMAVMIFKRAVFESRRKPKGMLRPKQNINLKDLEKLPWPRTNTEKLLLEMFSSGAAQFLAILEALSDSNRHVLHAGPPVPDEPEIHDVIAELFFAGIDLLSGGGNKAERGAIPQSDLCKLLKQSSLLELAVEEKKYFSAEAVVKFAKLAFSYEQWDIFDAIIAPLYGFVKAENNTEWRKEELDLKILLAAETLLSGKKHKHGLHVHERLNNLAATWDSLGIFEFQDLQDGPADEHVILAETVFFCECNSFQDIQPDKDIVINVILFLWQKCKHGVQRIQAAASELSRFVHKCETNSKWIYILCHIYEVMQHSGFIDTDAVVMGEAALRLAGISESIADSLLKYGIKPDKSLQKGNVDSSTQMQISNRHALLKKNPVTQLMFAYQILEKAIKGMSLARSSCATGDETSVVDHYSSWLSERKQHLKDTDGEQKNSSKSLANTMMMMDLQLELILTQHRVSVKLLNLLQGDARNLRSSKSFIHTKGNSETVCFPTESELIAKMNKNRLSKAIFLMQKAVLLNNGLGKISPNQLLEESEKLIQRAEMEETAVYLSCVKQSESLTSGKKVPPPPILLCRTENSMKFRPAPFQSIVKVSWYCLYAQRVTGPNLKVRLNDHYLPGTGEKIPACSSNILEVKGLEANEKYIFAVAAYSSDGNLIGDAIGETTKPILAFPPLSIPATWAYLAQSSYHIGNYKVAKKSILILWNYFVLPTVSPPSDVVIVSASNETYISQKRICSEVISMCSPILLQLFLRSIFIMSDISIKEGALFCDSICNNDVLQKFQTCRIAECERLLVALDLSILLNDVNYSLQAVVQCYGLIAPIIYHKIPSAPVVQVIIKCLAVLQEIPKSTWNKKQAGVTEGVLHMIACMTYYAVKVLRSWDEYELAIAIVEVGKQLLDITESTTGLLQFSEPRSTVCNDTVKAMDAGEKDKGISSRKKYGKKSIVSERVNEHLSALEHTLLTLKNPSHKSELTGKEDPALLSHVVTCWPLNAAYKEVMKFKKRSRFMEFFSLLLQRIVCEENFQKSLEWTTSVFEYLKRRDAANLGKSAAADDDDVTVADDTFKRYTAGLVKYQKDEKLSKAKQTKQHEISTQNKERVKKQQKMKTSEQLRMSGEDPARTAFANLIKLLTPLVSRYKKNKRHTEICTEEMPWRSQMNLLLALTHFSLLRKKIDEQRSENLSSTQIINSYQILDPELFSLHHAGTVVMVTETNVKDGRISSPGHLHPSVKLALPFEGKLNDSYDVSGQTTKRSDSDTPRTQMTNDSETSSQSPVEQAKINIASGIILNHLGKTYIHLKRAMVLAHRGRHWTLLQNTCRILWNLTLELQLMLKQTDVTQEQFPITKDLLSNEICMPLYFAAEFILDMMVILQNSGSIQILDSDEKFSVPSCMGSIELEEGGSSLAFEYPFDDITVVDMRWMCDLVLKAIEVLYNLERWESLIHIAIQFNLITHERYTEQVTPLLIHAQRVLITKIKDLVGSDVITPYLTKNGDDHNERVHCRNYIGKQLSVTTMAKKGVKPRASINQKEQIVYSADTWTKALVCVPLDVMDTLTCFRESMQKSKYSARALKHSRKLLSLFLAYSQGLPIQERVSSLHGHSGRVSFTTGAMQAHQSVPPDLLEEDFHSVYSIESKAIPPSQLSAVIASYDRTIEILHSNNQQGLKAQALHELGNLHLCAGNKRAAFKCWCQALDETLNMPDALNSWQALDSSPDSIINGRFKDYSEKFLCRAGIWGCLQSAVITAKMSRYIFTSNINKKTECCILSAILFKALFRASLPHPKEDLQFALYDIGEDCEVSELVPGIDLFSDQYRADLNTVVGSLCFLISELHSAAQNIMVLPLFTLYQYFVSIICRDPVRSIEGRLLKIKVLTDLHLFTEAFHELCLLTRGRRIPRRSQKGFKLDGKLEKIPKYIASKTILSSENLQALEELFNRKPSVCLLSVCDHRLVNKVMLAKMYFIIKLSATINAIPETVMKSSYSMSVENTTLPSKDLKTHKSGKVEPSNNSADNLVLLSKKEHLTFAELKGILLNEAEERLDFLIQAIQSKNNAHLLQYPAVELEMEIEAKLYLCEIAQQKYQSALSVALAYSAMRSLQDADIFTMKHQNTRKNVSSARKQFSQGFDKKHDHPKCTEYSLPCDTEAREHMNIGIWLRCRLSLITAVRSQLHGVAVQEEEVLDSLNIITEGIAEAETFSDIEMQAHLMLQAALLDIQEGRPRNSIRLLLENIINLLEGKSFTSPTASLTLAQSLILLADLMEMENNDDKQELCTKQLDTLKLAHKLIIKELLSLGEAIEHHVTNEIATVPLAPLRNIYLPHINLLAEVKRRIGHVLYLKVCSLSNFNMDPSPWLPSLNLHTTALELSRMSAFREYNVEAELLFQKGKIERQMFMSGDHAKCLPIKTFAEAIKLSLNYNHNLGLIRKCYLEIALLYFHLASLDQNKTPGMECPTVEEQKIAASKGKVDNVKDTNGTGRRLKDRECYSILAWIAIRAATQVGSAILAYKVLVGQNVDTLQNLDENLYSQIPIFASADLLAKYKNYLKDDGQICIHAKQMTVISHKGEGQENDLSNLPLEMPSWVHLIRYHNHLLRLINVIHLTGFPKTMHEKLSSTDWKSASMLSNGLSLRFSVMHLFLKKHLCHYSACCANEFPQELLKGVDLQSESHKIFFESNQRQEKALSPKKVSLSVESKAEAQHEFVAMKSLDKELCVQWYRPSLERGSENRELTVMLIYAYNKNKIDVKNTTNCDPDNIFCGHKWIPLSRVVSLHEKLSVLKQKAEISLQYMTDSSVTEHGEKQKRSTQNSKNKADQKNYFTEELQEVIIKHCCEVQYLLNCQDPQPLVKAPFDITLPSLIRLETFFDLTHGCMLMKGSLLDWIVSLLI